MSLRWRRTSLRLKSTTSSGSTTTADRCSTVKSASSSTRPGSSSNRTRTDCCSSSCPTCPTSLHQPTSHFPNNTLNAPGLPQLPSIDRLPRGPSSRQHQLARGYRVLVRSLRGYRGRAAVCVRVAVVKEGAASGEWVFTTKYHDESAPRDDHNPYNPTTRNRLDESGAVLLNESFEMREDLQARFNRSQCELFLWVMVLEKDDLKMSNEPGLYVWYCFKLTHFGHLREGAFTLAMYHDAFPFLEGTDMNRMRAKGSE